MNVLSIIGVVVAFLFLFTMIRAMIFANRHKDRFADLGILGKAAWWFQLFKKDGFGPEAEAERRRLARALIVLGALFLALGGMIQLMAPAPA